MEEPRYTKQTRFICILLAVAFLCALAPLLYITQYSHPTSDDYMFGNRTHRIWLETGSFSAVLKGAADYAAYLWRTIQGSYSAIFLMSLQPGVFGEAFYGIGNVIIILSLVTAYLAFLWAVVVRLLHGTKAAWLVVSFCVVLSALQFPPSGIEAFYWFNGSVYYTFFFSCALFLLSLVIRYLLNDLPKRDRNPLWLFMPLLALFTGGGNLTTLLVFCVLLLAILPLAIIKKRDGVWLYVTIAFFLIGFFTNVLAPGNAVRQLSYLDHPGVLSPVRAVFMAMVDAFAYSVQWTTLPVIVTALLALPALWRLAKGCSLSFRFPLISLALLYILLGVGFAPPEYSMANEGPMRLRNAQYFLFLLLFYGNVFYWVGWVQRTFYKTISEQNGLAAFTKLLGKYRIPAFLLALCMIVGVYVVDKTANSFSAAKLIITGEGANYDAVKNGWYQTLTSPETGTIVELEPLPSYPKLLSFEEIGEDPFDDYNQPMSAYYGKQQVYTRPADGLQTSD